MAGPNRQQSFSAVAVSKSDTVANVFEGFMVTTTGDVKVTTDLGATPTFVGVAVNTVIPIRTTLIWSAGTTATGILGLKYPTT